MSENSPLVDGVGQPNNTPSPRKGFKTGRLSSDSSKSTRTIASSGSMRSKGFSLNLAVSPASSIVTPPQASTVTLNGGTVSSQGTKTSPGNIGAVHQRSMSDHGFDVPLPPPEKLSELDIDTQLRLLALREMEVVEIKDNINKLNNKLEKSEGDLHKLREIIQRSLYKELRGSANNTQKHQRNLSNPRDEAIASTKNRSRGRTLSSSYSNASKVDHEAEPETAINTSANNKSNNRNSNIWSNFSKPLNLIQQFDNMLQTEFEKSLIPSSLNKSTPGAVNSSPAASHKSTLSEESIGSITSIPSPLKSKSKDSSKTNGNSKAWNLDIEDRLRLHSMDKGADNSTRNTEDMLHTVSNSIWSFVNDVKQNVLSSLEETPSKANDSTSDVYDTTLTSSNKEPNPLIDLSSPNDDAVSSETANINNNQYQSNLDDKLDALRINDSTNDVDCNDSDDDEKIDLSMYSSLRRK